MRLYRRDKVLSEVAEFPRTREGCDVKFKDLGLLVVDISIHAPVKGATLYCSFLMILGRVISIHAPVKGATRGAPIHLVVPVISIHAPVKGATSDYAGDAPGPYYFNPRTREGCDSIYAITGDGYS